MPSGPKKRKKAAAAAAAKRKEEDEDHEVGISTTTLQQGIPSFPPLLKPLLHFPLLFIYSFVCLLACFACFFKF